MRWLSRVLPLAVVFSAVSAVAHAIPVTLYTNGLDAGFGANQLSFPAKESEAFHLGESAIVQQMIFSTWATNPGAVSVDWKISTAPLGTGLIASGTSAVTNVFNFNASYGGYKVYNSFASVPDVALVGGTYWLTLQTPAIPNVYWGVNSVGSPGNIGSWACEPSSPSTSICKDTTAQYNYVLEVDGTRASDAVPEPATLFLVCSGLAGFGARRCRMKGQPRP